MKYRMARHDIKALQDLKTGNIITLSKGQSFHETIKSYELWDNSQIKNNNDYSIMLKRINKKRIGFIFQY